jgi:hypothetical protein
MSQEKDALRPDQALRRFLDAVADEAAANHEFRNRLLFALGTPILFQGEEDIKTLDPVEMCGRKSEDEFVALYSSLTAAQIKRILTTHSLATTTDLRGVTAKDVLAAMLWKRARNRATERGR